MHDITAPVYFIETELGADGPYDIDGLRRLVALGRLSPDDRLLRASDRKVIAVLALVPDAAELYRRVASDRVVRKTSDRIRNVDQRRRTPIPLPIEGPDESPVAAVEQTVPQRHSDRPLAVKSGTTPSEFQAVRRFIPVLAILMVAAIAVWVFPFGRPDQGPFPPPDIPALTATELEHLSDRELLPRIEQESMRRMLVSNLDLRVAVSVLSPPAQHLLTLVGGENVIRNFGLQEQLRIDRDSIAGASRPLAAMMESYRALQMEVPADLLAKAQNLSATQVESLKKIEAQYQEVIERESSAKFIAYAKAHRRELFPDLYSTGVPNKGN